MIDDIARAMAAFQGQVCIERSGTLSALKQRRPGVSLTCLLQPENLRFILNDEEAVAALLPLLPDGMQSPHELEMTVVSACFCVHGA